MIECMLELHQRFHFDQIHLQADTGKKFVGNIIRGMNILLKRIDEENEGVSDGEGEDHDAEVAAGFMKKKIS